METVAQNAKQSLALHKTRRASDLTTRSVALQELADALGMDQAPLRIECYDISHLQGTNVVASMVVFEDGLPRKSEYRRFTIKGSEEHGATNDDVRAMHEVITRRFKAFLKEQEEEKLPSMRTTGERKKFSYPPQLVVVDGGQPQVAAAARALADLEISDVTLVGLAKRLEEVWLPDEDDPVLLPRSSARACTCCSGCATRLTASASPSTGRSGPSRWSPAPWTMCPVWGKYGAKPCWRTSELLRKLRAAAVAGNRRSTWYRACDRAADPLGAGGASGKSCGERRHR